MKKDTKSSKPAKTSPSPKSRSKSGTPSPEAVITSAESLIGRQDYAHALTQIQTVRPMFPFDEPLLSGRYLRALSFAEAHAGNLTAAEDAAILGQLLFPEVLDFPFALCSIKLGLKDYAGARQAGERFVALREQMRGKTVQNSALNRTGSQTADIYLWLGTACKQAGDIEIAQTYLNCAISADQGAQAPYIQLATTFQSLGRHDEAQAIIERGCTACRNIAELRLLAEAFKPHPSISACMIVKNEEELLPGCLDSIRDWVDEIIIVDTGSTDRTVEIARSYGAKVLHQPWEGNFSKHRNYSLDQATGDWVLIIDADERIVADDIPAIKQIIADARHSAIAVSVFNVYEGKHAETFLPSIRFFRRSLNLRYDGIVHNTLVYPADLSIARANIRLKHLGYGLSQQKMRIKLSRTKELLHKQLAGNPNHAFGWFNLAQALRGEAAALNADTTREVIAAAEKAVALTKPDDPATRHIHLMALDQLAWAHFGRGAYEKALGYAQLAISHKANYLDPLLLLGHIYARQQRYAEAERAYRHYLDVQSRYQAAVEVDNIIFLHLDSRASAHYALGAIAEIRGEVARAIQCYRQTIAITSDHLDVHERVGRLLLSEGDLIEAEASFSAHLAQHSDSVESRLGLAYIKWARDDRTAAESLYLEVLDLQPDSFIALSKLCKLYLELAQQVKLDSMLDRAVAAASRTRCHDQEMASLLFACRRFAQAAEWYEKAIELHPADATLQNDLGNCYYKLNRPADAARCYAKSLSLPNFQSITWRNLALAQARTGNHRDAAVSMEQFVKANPAEVENLLLLADLYQNGEDFEAAIRTYERYLLTNPGDPTALFGLSEGYLALGHKDSALLGYRRVLQIDPDFALADQRIGELERSRAAISS